MYPGDSRIIRESWHECIYATDLSHLVVFLHMKRVKGTFVVNET